MITTQITDKQTFNKWFSHFTDAFIQSEIQADIPVNGLFGYLSYDAVKYFEKIEFKTRILIIPHKIPDARYHLYKYIIAINHYQNTLQIIENQINGEPGELDRIESLLNSRNVAIYSFKTVGEEITISQMINIKRWSAKAKNIVSSAMYFRWSCRGSFRAVHR